MPYFAVFYEIVDDFVDRRTAFREKHLQRVSESYARGELILGGALGDPTDLALLVFHTDEIQTVESFVRNDPYVSGGLVINWQIRPWNVVTGNETSLAPVVPKHPKEIVRAWSARTSKELWPQYREHFTEQVLRELHAIAGYLGATLSVRPVGEQCEILVESYWRSLDAIRSFTGVDLEKAVVASEVAELLAEHDQKVRHFEIVLTDRAGS